MTILSAVDTLMIKCIPEERDSQKFLRFSAHLD